MSDKSCVIDARDGRRRTAASLLSVLGFCLALSACVDGSQPLAPGSGPARLQLLPRFSTGAGASLTFNMLRATVTHPATDALLAQDSTPVSDQDPAFELQVDFAPPADVSTVNVLIELVDVSGGIATTAWSGRGTASVINGNTPDSVHVIVHPGPPSNLDVTGVQITTTVPPSLLEGDSIQLAAVAQGGTGAVIFWQSSDPTVATVSATGMVHLLRNGIAHITASAGPSTPPSVRLDIQPRAAAITLVPSTMTATSLGEEVVVHAEVRDARGALIPGAAVNWSVDNGAIAQSLGDGRFIAQSNGSTSFTAAVGAVSASGTLTVQQAVARITVDPGTFIFASLGMSQQFTATAVDAGGSAVADAAFTWSRSGTAVSVTPQGLVTATAIGESTVTATAAGVSGSATAVVQQVVTTIEVAPTDVTLTAAGETASFTAIARDGGGSVMPGAAVVWSSSNPGVATVSAEGVVTAVSNGAALVTATAGSASGAATVTVVQEAVSIEMQPQSVTLSRRGDARQFIATARDAGGDAIEGVLFTWSSSNEAAVTVNDNGVVLAVGYGTATITAALGDAVATGTVHAPPPVVSVAPESVELVNVGDTATLAVSVRDGTGNVVQAPAVEWASSDADVATVIGGFVTATGPGEAVITATYEDVSTSVVVVVTGTETVPDLSVVAAVLVPGGDLVVGDPAGISVELSSGGVAAPGTAVQVKLLHAGTGALVQSVMLAHPPLPAAGTVGATFTFTPQASWPDSVYATVRLDATNLLAERDEENNLTRVPAYGAVRVLRREPGSVALDSVVVTMANPGDTRTVVATIRDSTGTVIAAPLTWSSLNTSVATVNSGGVITAAGGGSTHVIAATIIHGLPAADTVLVHVGVITPPVPVSVTWVGHGSADPSWSNASNWDRGTVPGAGDVAFIPDCPTYGIETCSYPRLTGPADVGSIVTGIVYEDVEFIAAADALRDAARAARSALRTDAARDATGGNAEFRRAAPARLQTRSLSSAAALATISEFDGSGLHILLQGHTLTIHGSQLDESEIGSADGTGVVVFTGAEAEANGYIHADATVLGQLSSSTFVSVSGNVTVLGRLNINMAVGGELNLEPGSTLEVDFGLVTGNVNAQGADIIIEGDGFLLSEAPMTMTAGSTLDVQDGGMTVGHLTIDQSTARLDGDGYLEGYTGIAVTGTGASLDVVSGYVFAADYYYTPELPGVITADYETPVTGLSVVNGATFAMPTSESYILAGDVLIDGASTEGLLLGGELYVFGNMAVGNSSSPTAYAPGADHYTAFGTASEYTVHYVAFAQPGTAANGSRFHGFSANYNSEMAFMTDVVITGDAYFGGNVSGTSVDTYGGLVIAEPEGWSVGTTTVRGYEVYANTPGLLNTDLHIRGSTVLSVTGVDGDVRVEGSDAFADVPHNMTIVGSLAVADDATLRIRTSYDSTAISVGGDFTTMSGGVLSMIDHTAYLVVYGDATFNGGSTADLLQAGTIRVRGNFIADGAAAFQPYPLHRTILNGTVPNTVTMSSNGVPADANLFGVLEVTGAALTLLSHVAADELRADSVTFNGSCASNPCTLTVRAAQVDGAIFNNVDLDVTGGMDTLLQRAAPAPVVRRETPARR